MSRSKQHDRNRRIANATGHIKGKGHEHPNAQFTRDYQTWRKSLITFESLNADQLVSYEKLCAGLDRGEKYRIYGTQEHYKLTLLNAP